MTTPQIKTFGCRINFYESEIIRQIVKDDENCIVVNTCTVTAESHRQCLQQVRKLRRENPDAKIIVTGCAVSVAPDDFTEIADVIIHNEKKLVPSLYGKDDENPVGLVTGFDGRNRAFLQVQQGCDFKCTYCIVPRARGASYSIPYPQIKKQIEMLIENGVQEIVLTGINLSDYDGGIAKLTKLILDDFADIRLRYGSLDPASIDDEILELFKDKRLLPHLHLSIQSGDNLVLKRMGRRHNREKIMEISEKLRAIRPEIMMGSDFIAGFPTETDEQFNNTVELVKQAGLSMLHVFPYSERPSTPAELMPQVDKTVRKQRAETLRNVGEELLQQELSARIGKVINVLFETDEKGHSDEFIMVNANGKKGEILPVLIKEIKDNELVGEVV